MKNRVESALPLETVNWHITHRCNYTCKFCFFSEAAYRAREGLPNKLEITLEDQLRVLRLLKEAGANRITFTGGEPTLVRSLPRLIHAASQAEMAVVLVTNGTGITDTLLNDVDGDLAAIKVSLDSTSDEVEARLGRGHGGHIAVVRNVSRLCKEHDVLLMVNTVVTSLNIRDDLRALIRELSPYRWKIFQYLPVPGQNDVDTPNLSVSVEDFEDFLFRHRGLSHVAETNDDMWESYVMLDPIGRFFQDDSSGHKYSESVLDVGVSRAIQQVGWRREKFVARGGRYQLPRHTPSRVSR